MCWTGCKPLGLGPAPRIYLAARVTAMRKGFEGLYGLAGEVFRAGYETRETGLPVV